MSFESFKREREARMRTPEFQDAMNREKAEFSEQLRNAGRSSMDFLYGGVIKGVLGRAVRDEAKSAFSGKYNMVDALGRNTRNIASASMQGLEAAGKIAGLAGKGIKIGSRYLVGK